MNSVIKNVAIFAAGAGIGFFVGKKFYQEKYRREADEDIASMKEFTTQRINEMKQNIMDIPDAEEVEISTTEDIEDISEEELKTNESIVMKYDTISKEGKPKKEETVEEETPDPRTSMSIYVISEEEFMEDGDFDKVSLEYFCGDGVLVDDRDIPVEDPDKILGEGTLDDFVVIDDVDMYVRNENISIDYEITKSEGSYRDFIEGPHNH